MGVVSTHHWPLFSLLLNNKVFASDIRENARAVSDFSFIHILKLTSEVLSQFLYCHLWHMAPCFTMHFPTFAYIQHDQTLTNTIIITLRGVFDHIFLKFIRNRFENWSQLDLGKGILYHHMLSLMDLHNDTNFMHNRNNQAMHDIKNRLANVQVGFIFTYEYIADHLF